MSTPNWRFHLHDLLHHLYVLECSSTDSIPVSKVPNHGDAEKGTGMRRANSYQPTSMLATAITSPLVIDRKSTNPAQEYVRPKRVSTSTGHQRPAMTDSISAVPLSMQQSGFIPLVREDGSSSTTPPNNGGVHSSVSVPKRLIPLPGAVPFLSESKDPNAASQTNIDTSRSTPGTSSLGTNRSRRSRTSSVSEESRTQHIPDLAHAHQQSQAQLITQGLQQLALSLNNGVSSNNSSASTTSSSTPADSHPVAAAGSSSHSSNPTNHIQIPLSLIPERKNSSDELLAMMGCPALQTPPSSGPASPAVNSLLNNDGSGSSSNRTPRDRLNDTTDSLDDRDSESPSSQLTPSSAHAMQQDAADSIPPHMKQKVGMASSAPATSSFRGITVSTVASTGGSSSSSDADSKSGESTHSTPGTSLDSKADASLDALEDMPSSTRSNGHPDSIINATNAAGKDAGSNISAASYLETPLATSTVSLGTSWEDRTETESVFSSCSDQVDEYSDDDDLGYVRISSTGTNARLLIQHLSVFSFDDGYDSSSTTDSDDSVSSEEPSGDEESDSDSSVSSDEDGIHKTALRKKFSSKSTEAKAMATSSSSLSSAHAGVSGTGSHAVMDSSSSSLASVGTLGATSTMFQMDDVRAKKRGAQPKRYRGPSKWTNRSLPPQGPLPYLTLPEPLENTTIISSATASSTAAAAIIASGSAAVPGGAVAPTTGTAATFEIPDFSIVNVKRARGDTDQLEFFNMKIVYDINKTGFEATHDFPIRIGDVIAGRYEIVEYLGSAAFSRAVKCIDHLKGTAVCLKIIKNNKDYFDQSLDEIKLLTIIRNACRGRCDDFHVLELFDYFYFKEHLFLVCELLRENLYEVYKYNRQSGETLYFNVPRLQRVAWQSLLALNFIHSRNLIHCDLKPENILIKSYSRSLIKVIDFGSSCFTSDQLSSYVQSRSYRAPEVVLGYPYDQRIDMWSLGCILGELWTGRVLFQNESLGTLIAKHIGIIGLQKSDRSYLKQAPLADDIFTAEGVIYEKKASASAGTGTSNGNNGNSPQTLTVASASAQNCEFIQIKRTTLKRRMQTSDHLFLDFVTSLLRINPEERPTSWQAMHHPWFRQSYPDP